MRHLVVVANGEFPHPERLLALLCSADLVVAADGGANWLVAQGRRPDVLIGDLDSVDADVLSRLQNNDCTILRYPAHKDETDTELALSYAAAQSPQQITLIGALGGRIDHELATIMLLSLPALRGIPTAIYDGASWLTLIAPTTLALQGQPGDIVSLLPLGGECLGVTTAGLVYPLIDEPLFFGPARGVSNEMLEQQASVTIRAGQLLVVYAALEPIVESPFLTGGRR